MSAWPAKANRCEPAYERLDYQMVRVQKLLDVANYGATADAVEGGPPPPKRKPASVRRGKGKGPAPPAEDEVRPLIELGYSVVLCVHQHRHGGLRQRWFLSVVDWYAPRTPRDAFGNTTPMLAVPNAVLPHSLEAEQSGLDGLARLVLDGRAVLYDSVTASVYVPPEGVFVRVLVEERKVRERARLRARASTRALLRLALPASPSSSCAVASRAAAPAAPPR